MTHGGKREGAARKPEVPDIKTQERVQEIETSGLVPLDYMLAMLRDETQPAERRMWAAGKAAPFVHPKLAAIQHTGPGGGPIEHMHQFSDADLMAVIAGHR